MAMPTNAELAILRVLWRDGPRTVREVHEAIYRDTGVGYTSALKLMQNMLAKGLVTRVDDARQHVYAAAVRERPTLNRLVGGWIDTAFSGSSLALAMQALEQEMGFVLVERGAGDLTVGHERRQQAIAAGGAEDLQVEIGQRHDRADADLVTQLLERRDVAGIVEPRH